MAISSIDDIAKYIAQNWSSMLLQQQTVHFGIMLVSLKTKAILSVLLIRTTTVDGGGENSKRCTGFVMLILIRNTCMPGHWHTHKKQKQKARGSKRGISICFFLQFFHLLQQSFGQWPVVKMAMNERTVSLSLPFFP